jgi:hypothetical protein
MVLSSSVVYNFLLNFLFGFQFDHEAEISFPKPHWGVPAEHPVPVGSEIIIRRDGRGKVVSPNHEDAKKLTPKVGIVMGTTNEGDYVVGLLKAKEVVLVPIEHTSVSLNHFQGPSMPKFIEFMS